MRLLYICSDFGVPPNGTKGASIHLRAITGALARGGHEIMLLSPLDGPGDDHPARRVLPSGCKPVSKLTGLLKPYLNARALGDAVAREMRSLLYNPWALKEALAALSDRPPDIVIERLSLFGHLGVDLADAFDIPLIVEVNAPLTAEASRFRALQMQPLAEKIQQRVLSRADAIVAVSQPLVECLTNDGVDREKIHAIPNGVDIEAFDAAPDRSACRAALGITEGFVVGFAGSLKPWHGVDVLISAYAERFAKDTDARLLIVGKGPEEKALHQQAATMGIADRVTFTGAVDHTRIPILLGAMDVAVAPFKAMEDFYFSPIKLFEYMAASACVVASRLGQIEDVIEDGTHGVLVPAENVTQLADALQRLKGSVRLRDSLSSMAHRLVSDRYTWRHAGEATWRVVERALTLRSSGQTREEVKVAS